MACQTQFLLSPQRSSSPNGFQCLPRKWPVPFAARLRSEQGVDESGAFPVPAVRREWFIHACSRGLVGRRADAFYRLTLGDVSQLDQDISTALATIREWRNSFVHVNRIPLDVLSLIPTHLPYQKDRFRASYVCRHWRRTFLQHAALWSQLNISMGAAYTKTLLERAKGSALDITINFSAPAGTVTLLLPQTAQLSHLHFNHSGWKDIQRFSEIISGPLPLLHTLKIDAMKESYRDGLATTPPSLSLFRNAINLRVFSLCSSGPPLLGPFIFPNLTTLNLSARPASILFHASQLLNFLEASPMLQTVHLKVIAYLEFEGVPRETVVVLPNVETFSLVMRHGGPDRIATHISCPSARRTSITREIDPSNTIPEEIFPASASLNAIIRQYTKSPVEEIALELKLTHDPIIACSLTFRSHNTDVLSLDLQFIDSEYYDEEDEFQTPLEDLHYEVFRQASRTIQDHPLLANVERLRINHKAFIIGTEEFQRFSDDLARLFKSVGPLEELTMDSCDLHLYYNPFPNPLELYDTERLVEFPPIRELVISHPLHTDDNETCISTIVELARSQHALGKPFERMTVRMSGDSAMMAERLAPWVGAVECYDERTPMYGY